MIKKSVRIFIISALYVNFFISSIPAQEVVCEFTKLPDEIVEAGEFEVQVKYIVPEGWAMMHCEMKDTSHNVLKVFTEKVSGKGEKKFKFIAPGPSEKEELIMAVWLGEDWRNPLAPIQFSDPIPVVHKAKEKSGDVAGQQTEKTVPAEKPSAVQEVIVEKGRKGSIAILKEKFKDADLNFADALGSELRRAGYGATFLNGDQLSEKSILSTDNFFLLVLPHSRVFPASARNSLVAYLRSGGNLLCFEGPPFRDSAWKFTDKGKERWLTRDEVEEFLSKSPERNILFNFEDGVEGWAHSSNGSQGTINPESPGAGGTGQCARVDVDNLQGWDCFVRRIDSPFLSGYDITSFWAKGDEKTKQLMIEWTEEDRSRWFAVVNLEREWKFYTLSPKDFKYWPDNPSKGRGGPKDMFNPRNAVQLMFGVAFGQTNAVAEGPHTFWIDEIGTLKNPFETTGPEIELEIEALSPLYKFYPLKEIVSAEIEQNQTFIEQNLKFRVPAQSWSVVHRPRGVGYQPNMKTRWIPLIYAKDKTGVIRGTLAYLYISHSGKYNKSVWGAFSIPEEEFLKNPALMSAFTGIVERIKEGVYLLKAGSREFSYFPDETSVQLGALVGNFSPEEKKILVRISVYPEEPRTPIPKDSSPIFRQEQELTIPAGEKESVEFIWEAGKFTAEAYNVRTELLKDGKLIDILVHEIGILPWTPESRKEFVTIKDGDFWLRGEKWYPLGVNYWPLYVSGMGRDEYWSHWLAQGNYDPELVEPDLKQLKEWGATALSISSGDKNCVRNTLDFMRRCRKYDIHINMYIGENFQLIKQGRFDLNDTLFAYDVAWEPSWGTYDGSYGNQKGRKGFEREWKDWVIEKYGSVENAEKDWEYSVSRGSRLPAPSDQQLNTEGEHLKYVCAYRRFVDDYLCRKYWDINRKIKELDPNHFVSFRMSIAGDVWQPASSYGYDFRGIAKAVDFLAPEGYGLNGDWERVKGGFFTVAYARYAAPAKPVIWAEFGMSIWTGSTFEYDRGVMEKQGTLWADILKMIYESGANGGFGWWYPGGYRVDEKSDFGIAPPDRNLRPAGKSFIKYAPLITKPREIPEPVKWFIYDRDLYCRGYKGFFEEIKDEFFDAIKSGIVCGFKTKGTGTNSINTPLVAVGNTEYNGSNPPKYLNAIFLHLRLKTPDGWKEVEKGKKYTVKPDEPVLATAVIGNNGEASWVAPANTKGEKGGVYLVSTPGSEISLRVPIPSDVPYLGDAVIPEFVLVDSVAPGTIRQVELEMSADGRCRFGEKFKFTLVPTE